ncbi:hypothetical protein GCM10027176_71660 [Actinoallomurus bryophytorum]|nr:hypothetical protein [Actinoallomurus bryophytorum]
MPPRIRKTIVTLHVIFAVGWLGTDFSMLGLGITGFSSSSLETMRESYLSMERIGAYVVIPVALCAVLTGLLLGLGTRWGLLRYHWVTVKLVVGLLALTLAVLPLQIQLHTAATAVQEPGATSDIGFVQYTLIIAPAVALALYSSNVVLSIFKPWGMSAYGKRRAAGERRNRD